MLFSAIPAHSRFMRRWIRCWNSIKSTRGKPASCRSSSSSASWRSLPPANEASRRRAIHRDSRVAIQPSLQTDPVGLVGTRRLGRLGRRRDLGDAHAVGWARLAPPARLTDQHYEPSSHGSMRGPMPKFQPMRVCGISWLARRSRSARAAGRSRDPPPACDPRGGSRTTESAPRRSWSEPPDRARRLRSRRRRTPPSPAADPIARGEAPAPARPRARIRHPPSDRVRTEGTRVAERIEGQQQSVGRRDLADPRRVLTQRDVPVVEHAGRDVEVLGIPGHEDTTGDVVERPERAERGARDLADVIESDRRQRGPILERPVDDDAMLAAVQDRAAWQRHRRRPQRILRRTRGRGIRGSGRRLGGQQDVHRSPARTGGTEGRQQRCRNPTRSQPAHPAQRSEDRDRRADQVVEPEWLRDEVARVSAVEAVVTQEEDVTDL